MKIENIQTFNWESAIRGVRNPHKSWDKSDSTSTLNRIFLEFKLGLNDFALCMKLVNAGSEHAKFLRQIFISFDLTMPDYFWKEYSTYKVSTIENSSSTMHTLMKRDLTIDDFEWDGVIKVGTNAFKVVLDEINLIREGYVSGNDSEDTKKNMWRQIIQLLPMSFLYLRTCTLNYAVLRNMYHQRKNHKLLEWHFFLDEILKVIPYPEFITGEKE